MDVIIKAVFVFIISLIWNIILFLIHPLFGVAWLLWFIGIIYFTFRKKRQ